MALSRQILSALARRGVREIVLCAGARNAALVTVLTAARGVTTYSFFEERGAAFFALGRIMATGRPVAVITTSGTAVAECLPAVIEADYQRWPLIIVSADRPRRYRGTGAPQTITQPGMFSSYVELCLDIEDTFRESELPAPSESRPLHLNVCFDEPLLDQDNVPWDWPAAETRVENAASVLKPHFHAARPLVIVGGLTADEAARVKPILRRWGRPALIEGTSNLRGDPELAAVELWGGDPAAVEFDGVIRVGGVPTLRYWRDLEKTGLPTVHFSRVPLVGLPGPGVVHPLAAMDQLVIEPQPTEVARDRARAAKLEDLLTRFPLSEPAFVRRLSEWIPTDANLFLGNSLPIREWDLAATRGHGPRVFANRGANGIDGLISTFAGVARMDCANWAVLGDLSTLYDLSGPWAFRARPIDHVTIAVINNGGGKIFERIFRNPLFENRHDLEFENWARQWSFDYERVDHAGPPTEPRGPRVLELRPDDAQTAEFWRNWELK